MVILGKDPAGRSRGYVLMELVVAISILTFVLAGFATVGWYEGRAARQCYYRAIAMQIVDGEMEALVAGEWKAYGHGVHPYSPAAQSGKNLPTGRFILTVNEKQVRLEWLPASDNIAGRVVREAMIP